jgi:alpha-L-fucosidase
VRLREHLPLGQRVGAFAIDAWQAGAWTEIARATSIGNQRLLRLARPVRTEKVRLRVLDAAASPALRGVGLFLLPPEAAARGPRAQPARAMRMRVLAASSPGADALLDGNPDTLWLARGTPPQVTLALDEGTTLTAIALVPARHLPPGAGHPLRCEVQVSTDARRWRIAADAELANVAANPIEQYLQFDRARAARYVRVRITRTGDGLPAAIAGITAIPSH